MKRENNQNIKAFPMFILSFIPGIAHMYMGLLKRGFQLFLSFCILCSIIASSTFGQPIIISPIALAIYAFSFFDGYSCLRTIRSGEHVTDEGFYNNIKSLFNSKNRFWTALACFVLAVTTILNILKNDRYFIYSIARSSKVALDLVPAIILIALGIFLIVKGKKENNDQAVSIPNHDSN